VKRTVCLILSLCLMLNLVACGGSKAEEIPAEDGLTWQEQFDLGIRYLSEGKYEEAIIAFTAAIEIDPKLPDAYRKAAEAYGATGDIDSAIAILEQGASATGDTSLTEYLNSLSSALSVAQLQEELFDAVRGLDIPMTVGTITFGVSGIAEAKSTYLAYPYAKSNEMTTGPDSDEYVDDTVYTCFGMNGMPIPQGYYDGQFGFLFVESLSGGGIYHIVIQDPSFVGDPNFLCLDGLYVGAPAADALSLFHLPENLPAAELSWTLDNGADLKYTGTPSDFTILYTQGSAEVSVSAENNIIHDVFITAV